MSDILKKNKITVWDLPTRIFHWLLVVGVLGAGLTSFEESWLPYHVWFGETILVLVIFRLGWGLLGGRHSRFSNFVKSPITIEYIKRLARLDSPKTQGHNPLAWLIMLILLILLYSITLTGLVVLGGEEMIGPLARIITPEQGDVLKSIHGILSLGILIVVAIHLSGIILGSILQRENLCLSMITGKKNKNGEDVRSFKPSPRAIRLTFLVGIVTLFLSTSYIYPYTFKGLATVSAIVGEITPEDQVYRDECGPCHFAIHPSLLPKISWQKMMSDLENHFEVDAELEEKRKAEITSYLLNNSSDPTYSEASYKILASLSEDDAPQRVTETPYWIKKHEEIKEEEYQKKSVLSPINCVACHRKAEFGSFEDGDIHIPE